MDFKEHYKSRLNLNGKSARDGLVKRTKRISNQTFSRSPSYYIANIDGVERETIINNTSRYEEKLINIKPEEVLNLGSVIEYKEDKFILVEKDQDEIYKFGKMRICNNKFTIKKTIDKKLVGKNPNGSPKYEETIEEKKVPCIADDKYYSASQNAQLQLPEGKLTIIIQYQEDMPNVKANTQFNMYNKRYKIMDISYTTVVDNIGYVTIDAERVIMSEGDLND